MKIDIEMIKEIIYANSKKGFMSDVLEHGQVIGLRTGKDLELDSVSKCLLDYFSDCIG